MSNEAATGKVQSLVQFREEIQPMYLSRMLESDDPEQVYRAVKKLLPGLSRTVAQLNVAELWTEFEIRMYESRRGGDFHDAGLCIIPLLVTLDSTARDLWAHPGEFKRNNPDFLKDLAEACFFLFALRGTKTKSDLYYQVAVAGTKIFDNLTARQFYADTNKRISKHFIQLGMLLNQCASEPTVAK
jgi:hypothetical protein